VTTDALRRTLAAALVAVVVLLAAACGRDGGRATPEEALRSLQESLRTGDTEAVLALHDAETRAFFVQMIRTARARVAAGERPADAKSGDPEMRPVYLEGALDEAAGRAALELGQLQAMGPWLRDCAVLGSRMEDGDDGSKLATLSVRATDGTEYDVHFVREAEGWAFDAFRHYQERQGRR